MVQERIRVLIAFLLVFSLGKFPVPFVHRHASMEATLLGSHAASYHPSANVADTGRWHMHWERLGSELSPAADGWGEPNDSAPDAEYCELAECDVSPSQPGNHSEFSPSGNRVAVSEGYVTPRGSQGLERQLFYAGIPVYQRFAVMRL